MLFADQNAATTMKKHFKKHNDAVENGLLVLLNIIFFESRELLMGATHGQNKEVICPLACSARAELWQSSRGLQACIRPHPVVRTLGPKRYSTDDDARRVGGPLGASARK